MDSGKLAQCYQLYQADQGREGWPCHARAAFAVEVSGSGMYFVPILSPRI